MGDPGSPQFFLRGNTIQYDYLNFGVNHCLSNAMFHRWYTKGRGFPCFYNGLFSYHGKSLNWQWVKAKGLLFRSGTVRSGVRDVSAI